jgi:hypothetical protein
MRSPECWRARECVWKRDWEKPGPLEERLLTGTPLATSLLG